MYSHLKVYLYSLPVLNPLLILALTSSCDQYVFLSLLANVKLGDCSWNPDGTRLALSLKNELFMYDG